jgi:hypothetical protein
MIAEWFNIPRKARLEEPLAKLHGECEKRQDTTLVVPLAQ